MNRTIRLTMTCGLWFAAQATVIAAETNDSTPSLRRPIALQVAEDQRHLWVANRRSGTISAIDLLTRQVAKETSVGRQLSARIR